MNAGVVVGVFVVRDDVDDFEDEHAARLAIATSVTAIARNPIRRIERP
jgi:hypothetical protein